MKIDMHLFCLIGALATGITDGRISSSSQPVGGSDMEVTPPNRRELEPAIEYCTAIDRKDGMDGKQRGVVDWQGIDQCHKCAGGQLWWPCDSNLCTGFCTPKDVCDERIRAAGLQPALVDSKPHYCTVTDVGQRRGVVDQCHKCEGGQKHWPCNDENLCAGSCTPEDVCKERLKVAAAPVDCVNGYVKGYERGAGLSCAEACDGQCCTETNACLGFTGLVHKDGSCNGEEACLDATIGEVKGSSCVGRQACMQATIDEVKGSCTGYTVCRSTIATSIVDNNTRYAEIEEEEEQVEEDEETATELAEIPDPQRLL